MQTIAIVNQKGGVGKSTTAVNLGAGLVRQGKRVLLIDADSQANLTEMLGWAAAGRALPHAVHHAGAYHLRSSHRAAERYPPPQGGHGLTACQH